MVRLVQKLPKVQPWPLVFCHSAFPIVLEVSCTIPIDHVLGERLISYTTVLLCVGEQLFVVLDVLDELFDLPDETFAFLVFVAELSFVETFQVLSFFQILLVFVP